MGGTGCCPTYTNYTSGNNYSETLRLVFDGVKTNYSELLDKYWTFVPDPTIACSDPAYCPRIFYVDEVQRVAAAASIANQRFPAGGPTVALLPASDFTFWKAEEYHQNFDAKEGFPCGGTVAPRRAAGRT